MRFEALQCGLGAEAGSVLRRLWSSGVGGQGGVALQLQRQPRHPLRLVYPPLPGRVEGPAHRAGSAVAFQSALRQIRLFTAQLWQPVTQMVGVGQIGEDLSGWTSNG